MKFKIDQPTLSRALTTLSRSVASHPQLPVLANIKLAVFKKQLELSATDLQTGVVVTLGASSTSQGETTVPARVFSEFIASLPAQEIQGEFDRKLLKLSCGTFKAEINCIGAEEFPIIPKPQGKPLLTFKPELLASIVTKVAFAAAADEGRPVLTGVLVQSTKEGLGFFATDGYRMSQYLDASTKDLELKVIVPARALVEVVKIVSSQPEIEKIDVYNSEGARQLIFVIGPVVMASRLIEGSFPNTDKIVPQEHQTRAEIVLEEFIKAVRVAQVFARDSANVVRLEFDPQGAVTLLANTKQMGKNQGEVDAVIEGKENKIAFNVRYLLDVLGVLGSERFEFTMSEPLKPGVFKPLGEAESKTSFFHLIMPVRVQE